MVGSMSSRPDPDQLLAKMQGQDRRDARGKLRIYFGASAGVGKTYAMLAAARRLSENGRDVLVGVVETHGREETALQLQGLTVLPSKSVTYKGKAIQEFDIDTALELHPSLMLVDELAHSNAPGSRHPKRWQDVEELLAAGIDVFTTVNVQHLESLNDVVGGITSVRVVETIPDTVFDQADEVVLVDLPADELLARLRTGRVYKGEQAERASQNFFRKGNLIALRELALRRTADRVDDDVHAYRIEKSINAAWKTGAAILACIGPRVGGEHIVRSAARLASQSNGEWHVVYIETPQLQRLAPASREMILKTLKLSEELGAKIAVLSGTDIPTEIVKYAREQNLTRIVLGRGHRTWPWRTPHQRRIAELAPDVDLTELGHPKSDTNGATERAGGHRFTSNVAGITTSATESPAAHAWHYGIAVASSLLTAVIATPLLPFLDLANIVMLFLLTVVLVAFKLGRGPAVISTVVGVAAFDFFFVDPRFSFAVSDVQYLVTFAVMLSVGLITAHLTANLKYQALVASHRETRSRALYEFARELSSLLQTEQVFEVTRAYITRTFKVKATLLLPDVDGRLMPAPAIADNMAISTQLGEIDIGIAQWSFDRAVPAGMGTDTLPSSGYFYLPLVAPMRTRGVLVIEPVNRRWILIPEQRQHLDTFAALAAIALERVHYIDVAQSALVQMESERLRNSLLSALSHDLRTPLTSLVGLSESLATSKPPLAPAQQAFAVALHEETVRMSHLVVNLLDMARLQSGEVKLNLQWQSVEEIVGSALRACKLSLARHPVITRLQEDLPLVRFDAVLIERVLCNLLENASKYTDPDAKIIILAQLHGQFLRVAVQDIGPGIPAGNAKNMFEKFTRGERESATVGVGLGLAICKAIVEAHGGEIRADESYRGGASIEFTLPLGDPPKISLPEHDEPLAHHPSHD